MPLWYFFHSFGFWWVPNFGVYHVYSCLTCFDHWFVFYTLFPTCAFLKLCSCIAHNHLLHTPLLPLPCLGLYLVSSSLACHVYFIHCVFKVFCFLFELHFLIHLVPLMHLYPCSYFLFFPSFFLAPLSLCVKKGESTLESIIISIWLLCTF